MTLPQQFSSSKWSKYWRQYSVFLPLRLIDLYQKTLSPDHSRLGHYWYPQGFCRFHPSCSEYTKQALLRYGLLRGLFRGAWRVLRCNPWHRGGIDLPGVDLTAILTPEGNGFYFLFCLYVWSYLGGSAFSADVQSVDLANYLGSRS
ncbi:membrane protein insertion efficiency factor YidD [Candidatus Gracilibacteria bacterium]|nr:membrane protein insertion efficiency factor YidD [Candidatus Gracilibacteria bacterium]